MNGPPSASVRTTCTHNRHCNAVNHLLNFAELHIRARVLAGFADVQIGTLALEDYINARVRSHFGVTGGYFACLFDGRYPRPHPSLSELGWTCIVRRASHCESDQAYPVRLFAALYGVYVHPSGHADALFSIPPRSAFLHAAAGGGGGPTTQVPPAVLQSFSAWTTSVMSTSLQFPMT